MTISEAIDLEQSNSNISYILDIIYDYLDVLDSLEEVQDE